MVKYRTYDYLLIMTKIVSNKIITMLEPVTSSQQSQFCKEIVDIV